MILFAAWARQNLTVPLTMVAFTACCAAVYQSQEIDGGQYLVVGNMYASGTGRFRAVLKEEIGQGEISRWKFLGLMRDFWTDSEGLTLPASSEHFTASQGRAQLMKRIGSKAR